MEGGTRSRPKSKKWQEYQLKLNTDSVEHLLEGFIATKLASCIDNNSCSTPPGAPVIFFYECIPTTLVQNYLNSSLTFGYI